MRRVFITVMSILSCLIMGYAQVCFKVSNNYHVAPNSPQIIVADFNHDGKTDVEAYDNLVANVYFGAGSDTFVNPVSISLNLANVGGAAADFNGDTLDDMVFISDSLYLYTSHTNGSFTRSVFQIPSYAIRIATGDFNNDNLNDVVFGTFNNSVVVMEGNGTGGFMTPVVTSSSGGGIVRCAELNNDNNLDIVMIHSTGAQVLLGNGAGGFSLGQNLNSMGQAPDDIQIADFNNDNKKDILFNFNTTTVQIYTNNGSATFTHTPGFDVNSLNGPFISVADFNNDGNMDFACPDNYWVRLFFGNGISDFPDSMNVSVNGGGYTIASADFDHNNRTDLVLGSTNGGNNLPVLLNTNGITSVTYNITQPVCPGDLGTATAIVSGNAAPYQYMWSNNDTDSVISNVPGGNYWVSVTASNGCIYNNTYSFASINIIDNYQLSAVAQISNCAGQADLAVTVTGATPPYSYLWNTTPPQTTSTATGLPAEDYILTVTDSSGCTLNDTLSIDQLPMYDNGTKYAVSSTGPKLIVNADFNGDNKPDLATLNTANNISVLLNNGSGGFLAPNTLSIPSGTNYDFITADINNDNNADLLAARGNKVIYLLGNGAGSFASPVYDSVSVGRANSLAVSDFNGDNNKDIAVALFPSNKIQVLMGNGNGTFISNSPQSVISSALKVTTGDFNNDGKNDILISEQFAGVSLMAGNGNGTFGNSIYKFQSDNSVAIFTTHLNSDTVPDVVNCDDSRITSAINNGSGGFNIATNISHINTGAALGDVNNDGVSNDVISYNNTSHSFYILTTDSSGSYKLFVPFELATGITFSGITLGDFDADGKTDIAAVIQSADSIIVYNNCSTTKVNELIEKNTLVYPNPANHYVTIDGEFSGKEKLFIRTIDGRLVKKLNMSNRISTEDLAEGIYILQVMNGADVLNIKLTIVH